MELRNNIHFLKKHYIGIAQILSKMFKCQPVSQSFIHSFIPSVLSFSHLVSQSFILSFVQ